MSGANPFRFGFTLKGTSTFDSAKVRKLLSEAERKILQHVGARARALAKREIQPEPPGVISQPGESFHSHPARGKRDSGIADAIKYAYDKRLSSVVVGPSFAQLLYERQEFGDALNRKNPRRRLRKVGDSGLMVIGRTTRKGRQRFVHVNGELKPVTFSKIHTEKQLRHVESLEEEVYGPAEFDGQPRPVFGNVMEKHGSELMQAIQEAYGPPKEA